MSVVQWAAVLILGPLAGLVLWMVIVVGAAIAIAMVDATVDLLEKRRRVRALRTLLDDLRRRRRLL